MSVLIKTKFFFTLNTVLKDSVQCFLQNTKKTSQRDTADFPTATVQMIFLYSGKLDIMRNYNHLSCYYHIQMID